MPVFSSLEAFRDQKAYVPLLKKALLTVKPDTQKKFLYFKQFPFGAKKLPLVVVDYDPNCQAALMKAGHKPTAEGVVSLTTKDELNFEPKKGAMKRKAVKNYLGMMGGGIKPVFVPADEKEDDDDVSTATTATDSATPSATAATGTGGTDAAALLARIEKLRGQAFPPSVDQKKDAVFAKAKQLVQDNKLAAANLLLNEMASKALPPGDAAAAGGAGGGKRVDIGAVKWNQWFRATPIWPDLLTKASWDKNRTALGKMALSTGLGEQFKTTEAAFNAAAAKMPALSGNDASEIGKSTKACQDFMGDSTMKTLADSLKNLRDLARKAETDAKKSPLVPKSTAQYCGDVASAADALMVSCQANSLKGCLADAIKTNDAKVKLDKAWKLDDLKAEKDPAKRAALCQKLLDADPERSPQRDLVEDILAQALKEQGVSKAKDAYADQMKDRQNQFFLKNQKTGAVKDSKKIQDIMKKTGLTEAEVMAIRTFTADDYEYINPATANQKDRTDKGGADWMDQNRPKKVGPKMDTYNQGGVTDAGSKKSLYAEGSLHAGMMVEAFKKLPKKKATVYRGARLSPEEFRKTYSVGKIITYEAFASQSTDQKTARIYASGAVKQPPADATTSVYIVSEVESARDVMDISVYDKEEEELLLGPGTKLKVVKIEDDTQKAQGTPTATEWKIVYMKEVAD